MPAFKCEERAFSCAFGGGLMRCSTADAGAPAAIEILTQPGETVIFTKLMSHI